MDEKIIFKQEGYSVIGAAMEVYNQLGLGFLEAVYQEALEVELSSLQIPFISQPLLQIYYKDCPLKTHYVADLLVYDQIIIELKTLQGLSSREMAQLLNELKAAEMPLGLLINFGNPNKLEWKRFVNTRKFDLFRED
jgi:GxxExxY protein